MRTGDLSDGNDIEEELAEDPDKVDHVEDGKELQFFKESPDGEGLVRIHPGDYLIISINEVIIIMNASKSHPDKGLF